MMAAKASGVNIGIMAGGERYVIDPSGLIYRPQIGQTRGSGQWRMIAAIRLNNFGREVERIPFEHITELVEITRSGHLLHGNQKPKWHILDLDHGTLRQWGHGIQDVFVIG